MSVSDVVAPPPLAALADTITAAHATAVHADNLANVLIRISLKKRMLAGDALAAARKLLGDRSWIEWVEGLGITIREARRYLNFPAQAAIESRYKRYGGDTAWRSVSLPTTLTETRAVLARMDETVDTVPLHELARIVRIAEQIRFLYWDAADVRDAALDVALRAGARLRQPQERHPSPHHRRVWTQRDAAP